MKRFKYEALNPSGAEIHGFIDAETVQDAESQISSMEQFLIKIKEHIEPSGFQLFLGGTVGHNTWRDDFILALTGKGVDPNTIFNPVVKNGWDDEARRREAHAKEECRWHLYYLADPKQAGNNISAYSMVEATMALYDGVKTVIVFDKTGMEGHYLKAANQAETLLQKRFPLSYIFSSFDKAVDFFANALRKV